MAHRALQLPLLPLIQPLTKTDKKSRFPGRADMYTGLDQLYAWCRFLGQSKGSQAIAAPSFYRDSPCWWNGED
jgi:hypothetical protein